jgi:hypothetical protein
MYIITRYSIDTGQVIDSIGSSSSVPTIEEAPEIGLYSGFVDGETHYFQSNEPIKRPDNTSTISENTVIANDFDIIQLSNIPVPSKIYINNDSYDVIEEIVELTFGTPGTYKLRIEAFPYLPWEETINAY